MLRSKKGVKFAVWILLSVLIADVCRGIGSLEIGQRVVRYARSRTAEQSNIDGVGGRSPGIARKLHQRPVDDKSPCLKNGIEQYIPLRTGVKIGCLAHTEDQIVFDRNVLHTPLASQSRGWSPTSKSRPPVTVRKSYCLRSTLRPRRPESTRWHKARPTSSSTRGA